MTVEIRQLYPTEVMFGKFSEGVIAPVAEELLTKIDFTEVGSVNSDDNLLSDKWDLPVLQGFFNTHGVEQFKEYSKQVFDYELELNHFKFKAWAIDGTNQYNLGFHNHSGAQLSAVFYLLVEDSHKYGGRFKFHDPRFNANRGMTSPFINKHKDYEVYPETGGFMIFPSYLYHSVATFYGRMRLLMPVDMYTIS